MAEKNASDKVIGESGASNSNETIQSNQRKERKKRSIIWDHFESFTDAKGYIREELGGMGKIVIDTEARPEKTDKKPRKSKKYKTHDLHGGNIHLEVDGGHQNEKGHKHREKKRKSESNEDEARLEKDDGDLTKKDKKRRKNSHPSTSTEDAQTEDKEQGDKDCDLKPRKEKKKKHKEESKLENGSVVSSKTTDLLQVEGSLGKKKDKLEDNGDFQRKKDSSENNHPSKVQLDDQPAVNLKARKEKKKKHKRDARERGNVLASSVNSKGEKRAHDEDADGNSTSDNYINVMKKDVIAEDKKNTDRGEKKAEGKKKTSGRKGTELSRGDCEGENLEKRDKKKKKKKKKKKDGQSSDVETCRVSTNESGKEGSTSQGEGSKSKKNKTRSAENNSEETKSKGKSKKVRFSSHVEVFPSSDPHAEKPKKSEDGLLRGKRFTPEEDEIVKQAVLNYIQEHDLGEDGLQKVMNCSSHRLPNCWKDIGSCIPYRPVSAVYYRAHILFERAESRSWTPEEIEQLKEFHEKYGNNWKMIAQELGKHRFHVKDTWRRIKLKNQKSGHWTQEEYQNLHDLVNMDLRMKVDFQEKKSKHGMLRDNIPWGAISDKVATRTDANCCIKWYNQLTSSLVAEKKWADADDYRLIGALYDLDAACEEDVDWDNLLEHRPGDICRKRWDQMVLHIGHHGSKPFAEQVETLAKRYCPDLAETREAWDNKPVVP